VTAIACCTPFIRSLLLSVDIATRPGLDGPGIDSRWGARLFVSVHTGPEFYLASCTMDSGSLS
jgi:hypothetical protein